MKHLTALATAVAASVLIILGAGTANADNGHERDSGAAQVGTAPITEGLQRVLSGSWLLGG
ncbi:hypothetical protein GCM10010211_61530 [Streptomyces albospinus]|uniref:Uncharacterized protein n=1 Tax=Streptomyces albospinus TaxID=285515 RepID=A0ABQ2VHE5_9ACTN|nr:hypothetical protein [Streptomyces albospinus]GGU87068.1 hypothetical protein GCM10010211_61530 [Streptomyces albospinus]